MVSIRLPLKAKQFWDEWNLRSAVLFSLSFQIALILTANLRKRYGRWRLTIVVWSFYLLADWVAAFAVGLISSGLTNDCPDKHAVSQEIAAFWAPFLLLHLGGPEVITAFSLEDNELWIRHLLGLLIQLFAVCYVFSQSLSLPNHFWLPTLLLIFVGTCKYAERTRALYCACLGNFKNSLLPKPDPGPNYAQLMDEYSAMEKSHVPAKIHIENEHGKAARQQIKTEPTDEEDLLSDTEIVAHAYGFFKVFKGLVVDHMFSFLERNHSREFFFQRSSSKAFKILEIELNFMYDALFTKIEVVHRKRIVILRVLCYLLVAISIWLFFVELASTTKKKKKIFPIDIIVSSILLGGAVVLEIIAGCNLLFSDWTVVYFKNHPTVAQFFTKFRLSRWCNEIYRYSFIPVCIVKPRFKFVKKIAGCFGLKELLDEFCYKQRTPFDDELKKFIFQELRYKATIAQTTKIAKEIYSSKGEQVLFNYPSHYSLRSISSSLNEDVEYDESLLMWHVATELCYYLEPNPNENTDLESNPNDNKGPKPNPMDNKDHRKLCKEISDYMLYLLVMRPTLMSAVAGIAQIRFQDTCEEARRFFDRWGLVNKSSKDVDYKKACEKLLSVQTEVKPNVVKGDRSKSLLFDACILAKDLRKMEGGKMWEMMSKVWVELLSYGASHCRANAHAQQLSKGGELLTFVWLLMAHFGLGDQFRIDAGHARAKLLIDQD